jgi:hypothetical protein
MGAFNAEQVMYNHFGYRSPIANLYNAGSAGHPGGAISGGAKARNSFTGYWRWKSRSPGGRPRIAKEVRDLIRRMSFENPLWGATKIHGELLKLGIAVP